MSPAEVLAGPDYVSAWIRVDRLIGRVVVQRLKQGTTPKLDAQFERLVLLHRWLKGRLGN